MSDKLIATWAISLDVHCPRCKEYVDLVEYDTFWEYAKFQRIENGTDNSRDVDVTCPKCGHEFMVDFEY